MMASHLARDADLTVAAIPVPREEARSFGIIQCDDEGRIVAFHEKPEDPPAMPGQPHLALASMGNYVFKTEALMAELEADTTSETSNHDFGRDVVPACVRAGRRVFVYDFATNVVPGEGDRERGYWRDIGTVDAYWAAQMDLVEIHPMFNLYNARWPIRTGMSHDPPAKFVFRDEAAARVGVATDSLVSDGCIISGGRIHRSVLSPRVRINSFSEVEESILFENVNIGRYARIRRCIIDKDVDIPQGISIGYNLEEDRRRYWVNEHGIVVIPKRAKLGAS
jgi:glucose-1-phosphate adenylyltransferase